MDDGAPPPGDPLPEEPYGPHLRELRGTRQSVVEERPGDPYVTEMVARAARPSPYSEAFGGLPTGGRLRLLSAEESAAAWPDLPSSVPTFTLDPDPAWATVAAHFTDSALRSVALWAGEALVVDALLQLRSAFRLLLDPLAIDEREERFAAAARILGICPVSTENVEWPNPFATWPEARLAPARLAASRIRAALAELVDRLRADGVTGLWPVERVAPDADTPDGLAFGPDHVALLLLLWLDVPLEGRSGARIAGSVPLLGTVGWIRDRAVLLVGPASPPDVLVGDALGRSFARDTSHSQISATEPSGPSAGAILQGRAVAPRVARGGKAGASGSAGRTRRRRRGRPGRPRGTRYLTRPAVVSALRGLEADAAADRLRTREGRIRRYVTLQDLAERVDAPLGTLRDFLRANDLDWGDRAGWPSD